MIAELTSQRVVFCDSKRPGSICTVKDYSRLPLGELCSRGELSYRTNCSFWYQCLGNHDIVPGQSGVDFQTKVAPLYE